MDLHVQSFRQTRRRIWKARDRMPTRRLATSLLISLSLALLLPLAASAADPAVAPPDQPILISAPANAPSIRLDPTTAGAQDVAWTITLHAQYCGGYRIGAYVEIAPQWNGALPAAISADNVTFAGGEAAVTQVGDALRISPAPGRVWAQYCTEGMVAFDITIAAPAGMSNPATAGAYQVDVSTESAPTAIPVNVSITQGTSTNPNPGTTVDVGLADSGQPINLSVGQFLKLDLGSDYNWTPSVVDSNVLGPVYGRPFEFIAMQPGSTVLLAIGMPANCSWNCLLQAQLFWAPVVVHE